MYEQALLDPVVLRPSMVKQMQEFIPWKMDIKQLEHRGSLLRQYQNKPTLRRAKVGYITEMSDAWKEKPILPKQQGNHIRMLQYIIEINEYSIIHQKFDFSRQNLPSIFRFCFIPIPPSSLLPFPLMSTSSATSTKTELQIKNTEMLKQKQYSQLTSTEINSEVKSMATTSPIVPKAAQKLMYNRSELSFTLKYCNIIIFGTKTQARENPLHSIATISIHWQDSGNFEERGIKTRKIAVKMQFMKKSLLGVLVGQNVINRQPTIRPIKERESKSPDWNRKEVPRKFQWRWSSSAIGFFRMAQVPRSPTRLAVLQIEVKQTKYLAVVAEECCDQYGWRVIYFIKWLNAYDNNLIGT